MSELPSRAVNRIDLKVVGAGALGSANVRARLRDVLVSRKNDNPLVWSEPMWDEQSRILRIGCDAVGNFRQLANLAINDLALATSEILGQSDAAVSVERIGVVVPSRAPRYPGPERSGTYSVVLLL